MERRDAMDGEVLRDGVDAATRRWDVDDDDDAVATIRRGVLTDPIEDETWERDDTMDDDLDDVLRREEESRETFLVREDVRRFCFILLRKEMTCGSYQRRGEVMGGNP